VVTIKSKAEPQQPPKDKREAVSETGVQQPQMEESEGKAVSSGPSASVSATFPMETTPSAVFRAEILPRTACSKDDKDEGVQRGTQNPCGL